MSRLLDADGTLKAHFNRLAQRALGYGLVREDRGQIPEALQQIMLKRIEGHRLLIGLIKPAMELAVAILQAEEHEEWGGEQAPEWARGTEALLKTGAEALEGAVRQWKIQRTM